MSEFDPAPEMPSEHRWQEGTDTFSQIYDVIMESTSPTPAAEIAEIADCSANAAKKHLDRSVEMGIVTGDDAGRPMQYERNEGYAEWQDASRLAADLTVEGIIDRVAGLEHERTADEAEFDTTDPTDVSVYDHDPHGTIHERMAAVSEWQGLIREIRLYELARQLAQNDGHLIPAQMGPPPGGSRPSPPGPPDRKTLQLLARQLRSEPLILETECDPDAQEPRLLHAMIDVGQYPETIEAARLDIQWFTSGDLSLHYVERYADDSQWKCRWDRHPNPHNERLHFHQPPSATEVTDLSLDSFHPLYIYPTVLNAIESRVETLWSE